VLGGARAAGDAPRPGRGRGPRPAPATLDREHPTFGYRRLWALLRFHEGLRINRKAVYRVLVLKGWFVHQRRTTPRPRVQGRRSRASRSNERWAMDVTHIDCGSDGWAHLAAVIDCYDRELVGYEFARRGRAKEAERARGRVHRSLRHATSRRRHTGAAQ